MSDPRAPIFAFLRPYLKGKGWSDKALREGMDLHLDRLGAPKDEGSLASGLREQIKDSGLPGRSGPLTAIVGAIAATSLFATVPKEEGTEYRAYRDIAGIWTVCTGDTNDVHPGLIETPEGCRQRLEAQLVAHAKPVMACTPSLSQPGRDYQRAAAVSLAYNIGVKAWCHSSADKLFDMNNWQGGCNAFLMYSKAKVNGQLRTVRGLLLRRERERAVCLRGLA